MTSPLQHRRTSGLKHAWKMWRFEAKSKKVKRQRDREIKALINRK